MKRMPELMTVSLLALAVLALFPDVALAGGITEFAGPLEKLQQTITGPVGKILSIVMIAICGIGWWVQRGEDVAGIWKNMMGVVVVISLISFADKILPAAGFTFSGAVV